MMFAGPRPINNRLLLDTCYHAKGDKTGEAIIIWAAEEMLAKLNPSPFHPNSTPIIYPNFSQARTRRASTSLVRF